MPLPFSPGYVMALGGCKEGCHLTIGRSNSEQVTWVQHGDNPEHRWEIKDRELSALRVELADEVIDWLKRVHKYEGMGVR